VLIVSTIKKSTMLLGLILLILAAVSDAVPNYKEVKNLHYTAYISTFDKSFCIQIDHPTWNFR